MFRSGMVFVRMCRSPVTSIREHVARIGRSRKDALARIELAIGTRLQPVGARLRQRGRFRLPARMDTHPARCLCVRVCVRLGLRTIVDCRFV